MMIKFVLLLSGFLVTCFAVAGTVASPSSGGCGPVPPGSRMDLNTCKITPEPVPTEGAQPESASGSARSSEKQSAATKKQLKKKGSGHRL